MLMATPQLTEIRTMAASGSCEGARDGVDNRRRRFDGGEGEEWERAVAGLRIRRVYKPSNRPFRRMHELVQRRLTKRRLLCFLPEIFPRLDS
jgi:hypothetical protein